MPSLPVCTTSPFSRGTLKSALIQVLVFAFLIRTVPSMAVKLAVCWPVFPDGWPPFLPSQSLMTSPALDTILWV
jgi:hypothetical protein